MFYPFMDIEYLWEHGGLYEPSTVSMRVKGQTQWIASTECMDEEAAEAVALSYFEHLDECELNERALAQGVDL